MNAITPSVFLRCPRCGGKTRIQVLRDTVLRRFPLYCPKCRFEGIITYQNGKLETSAEPDAAVR